jgi:hypothetical protein
MTPTQLHENILTKLNELQPNFRLHRLHEVMLMECCENVVGAKGMESQSEEMLMYSTLQLFDLCKSMMRGLISGAITVGNEITLNYRNESFTFDLNSPFVKNILAQ